MILMGVKIDTVTLAQAKAALERPQIIFTPNPEILLEGSSNNALKKALSEGTLMLPDGHGLLLVSTLTKFSSKLLRAILFIPCVLLFAVWKQPFKNKIPEIIHGSDFMLELIAWSEKNGKSIFFLGGKPGVAEKTSQEFKSRYPKMKIAGFSSQDPGEQAFETVKKSRAEVLLVAYGAPKQEIFIANYARKIPTLIHAMGVGGSFDFWSGQVRRAPWFLRQIGFEWLWRLLINPKQRIHRIWNAVIVFPFRALFGR